LILVYLQRNFSKYLNSNWETISYETMFSWQVDFLTLVLKYREENEIVDRISFLFIINRKLVQRLQLIKMNPECVFCHWVSLIHFLFVYPDCSSTALIKLSNLHQYIWLYFIIFRIYWFYGWKLFCCSYWKIK